MKIEEIIIFVLALACFGLGLSLVIQRNAFRNDLIERNLAEWQVDAKTGITEFVIFE